MIITANSTNSEAATDLVSVQKAAVEMAIQPSVIRRLVKAELLQLHDGKVRMSEVFAARTANEQRIAERQAMHGVTRLAGPKARMVELVRVDSIDVLSGRRPINLAAAKVLAASMERVGLQTPISVRYNSDGSGGEDTAARRALVAGGHRLAAAKMLNWETIEAFNVSRDDVTARLLEIAENLHRAELTTLERDEQVAEWIQLTDDFQSAQVAPIENKRADGKGHRPEGGVSSAAKQLGIEATDAKRAVKVAALSPEAKQAARDAGLENNRSALLEASKAETPEQQVTSLLKRKPVDRKKVDESIRARAIRELAFMITDHVPANLLMAVRVNLEQLGANAAAVAAAIEKIEAKR